MNWLTDKKFLVGLAVGAFVLPRVLKFAQAQMAGMRATVQPQ